jgi:hypothetical protein
MSNTTNHIATPTTELKLLQLEVWDAYKDAYGVRPRHLTDAEWADAEGLKTLLASL